MQKSQLARISQVAIRTGVKFAVKKLERKLSPYIIKGVLIASYFGLLPSYKIRLREQVRCSSCGRWKKGYFRIIEIPQTGGMLRICSYCEKKKMRGLKKWLGV